MTWQPGHRRAQRALEAPYEDVPPHLRQPLWDWINARMGWNTYGDYSQAVGIDLRVEVGRDPRRFFLKRCNESGEFMLDVVESLLELRGVWDTATRDLLDLLTNANSAYTVREDGSGLELRVAPGVKELIQEAVDRAKGSPGEHLTNAWNAAYGRQTDPSKAYGEAIKAVEAALAPHVSPQNARQTLGTMIADVRNAPQKWKFVIDLTGSPGVTVVLSMMQLLWNGQTSRHGGTTPTRLETTDEARAAVHIAAALVQFGTDGSFAGA